VSLGHRSRTGFAGLALVAVALGLAGCGSGSSSGQDGGQGGGHDGHGAGSLTLYNGQHEATTRALVAGFEKRTGIDVSVRSGEGSELANQIVAEGKASPADVFYAEDSPALTALQDKHRLAKVHRKALAIVPTKDSSAAGRWVGVTARVRCMVYDPRTVTKSQLPSSVLGLAKPEWKGKVGIEATSGSLQAMVTAIRLTKGTGTTKQWLAGIKRNAKTFNSHDAILKAVNSGRLAAGMLNNYYFYRLRHEIGAAKMHAKLHFFSPGDPGSLVNVSGAAVLSSAPHPQAAQRFLAYLVSPAGQQVIQESDSFEYPLNPHVQANPALPKRSTIKPLRVPLSKLGHGLDTTLAEMRQAGLI
jgi:iron(III) transport system substrate-binding protein